MCGVMLEVNSNKLSLCCFIVVLSRRVRFVIFLLLVRKKRGCKLFFEILNVVIFIFVGLILDKREGNILCIV